MAPPKLTRPKRKRPPRLPVNNDVANGDGDTVAEDIQRGPPIKTMAPYPGRQLLILAACRFSEPVAMTSSFPYLFFMIRDFHLSDDEKKIGRYAGLLASSFSFAQFFSGPLPPFPGLTAGLPWGRLSDLYGRKPIVLCGLLGTVAATLAFGFSTTFTQALIARISAGLLNGNVGVIRTMVAEMVVERGHQARAFSVMPFVWSAGSILGPVLGGALADPVRQYPSLFGNSAFLARYPYALPNIMTASLLFVSAFFGFLYMKETLDSKKDQVDLGIRFRRFIARITRTIIRFFLCRIRLRKRRSKARMRVNSVASQISEFDSDDEGLARGPRRRESQEPMLLSPTSPRRPRRPSAYYRYRRRSSSFTALVRPNLTDTTAPPPLRFKDIFTKQVLLNMVVYAGLALHNISFDQLFPLLCSTKIADGGMGMTPGQIGVALSVAGVLAMVLQMTLFPWAHNKFGALLCIRTVLAMYVGLYFCVPFLPGLVTTDTFENTPQVWAGIIGVLWAKVIAGVFAFPICAILITQSSPSRELLGSVNGVNQALGSLCRAIGPAIAGSMYSHSLELGMPWIVWRYGLAIFAAVVWVGSWFLSDEVRLPNAKEYRPVADDERDDAIEEEEERLWREEEDGTVDVERAFSPLRNQKDAKWGSSDGRGGDQDDSDGSSDDDMVNGVSRHLLSREH